MGKCVLPPPCAKHVCFTTKLNSQPVPAGSAIWLSAAFVPRFPSSSGPTGVTFVNSQITIGSASASAPDAYVELISGAPSGGSVSYVSGQWQATVPLGQQVSFLSAASVTVPSGSKYSGAQVTWCGDLTAPGEVDVAIAAAVYSTCNHSSARPQGCDAGRYRAGAPTGCAPNLKPGGTGNGNGDCSGSFSSITPVCKTSGCSKPKDNSGTSGYAGSS